MSFLAKIFLPFLGHPVFLETLSLVKQNSRGKIWLMGGFLYRNLAASLYGGEVYSYDIDFLVEERSSSLKSVRGWDIEVNSYGNANYVRPGNKMSFTALNDVVRASEVKNNSVKEIIDTVPFTIQSLAYDLSAGKIFGQKGIEALAEKMIRVNNRVLAELYAEKKRRPLSDILAEKARELKFAYEIS